MTAAVRECAGDEIVVDRSEDASEGVLVEEKRRSGYGLWVTGPALVHSPARDNMVWFIRHGYVHALLADRAVAVHDIEAEIEAEIEVDIVGTTLGMTRTGDPTVGGPSAHMQAIGGGAGTGVGVGGDAGLRASVGRESVGFHEP